jgi:hypothetical protein
MIYARLTIAGCWPDQHLLQNIPRDARHHWPDFSALLKTHQSAKTKLVFSA